MNASSLLAIVLTGLAGSPGAPEPSRPLMHPKVTLLDRDGRSVLASKGPVSPLRTCGTCHDSTYIAEHSYHAGAGAERRVEPGQAPSGRPWDVGPGLAGRWDPLSYGPVGSKFVLEDWVRWAAGRHVGGGPAQSLGVETDCFLCHLPTPDHRARQEALRSGQFEWAATATLSATGVVKKAGSGWTWDEKAFDAQGQCTDAFPRPRATSSTNCGLCHGLVHADASPIVLPPGQPMLSTETKGQIFSAQLLKSSGLNLAGKESLARPFDIHAERVLQCGDCHSTINNPAQFAGVSRQSPHHLAFEPRRLTPGEYLSRPNHNLAKGHTPQGTVARELDGTMRRCEHCHDAEVGHTWLPYPKRHFQAVNCESCHIPRVFGPAREQTDWTLLRPDGTGLTSHRGAEGDPSKPTTLLHGFQPVLLPRQELDGSLKLTPHNVIATWLWVAGDPPAPVPLERLRQALLDGDRYRPEVTAALDSDGDGTVEAGELRLDTAAKVEAVRGRLAALGLREPRIKAEVQPYSLHHGVATGPWAVRECRECHGPGSRVDAPIALAEYVPGGVLPAIVADANVRWDGKLSVDDAGRLLYRPSSESIPIHVIGLDRWKPGDLLGALAVAGALLGAFVHGGLRIRAARKGH